MQWLLAEGGADITESSNNSSTALLLPSFSGQLETVQWLLSEGGADITESNNEGEHFWACLQIYNVDPLVELVLLLSQPDTEDTWAPGLGQSRRRRRVATLRRRLLRCGGRCA